MSNATYEPVMQFFGFRHLRDDLQGVSKPFHDLATLMLVDLPSNDERRICLRKLLEAKDAAVRAMISE